VVGVPGSAVVAEAARHRTVVLAEAEVPRPPAVARRPHPTPSVVAVVVVLAARHPMVVVLAARHPMVVASVQAARLATRQQMSPATGPPRARAPARSSARRARTRRP
jgi:hypothetical protein